MSAGDAIDAYLARLLRALALYPGPRTDVLDEVRAHLLEALDEHLHSGRSIEEAERAALAAFGEPERLARALVLQRRRARTRWLLPPGVVLGLALAFVDSRPTWDDTGVTVLAVLSVSALLGLLEPTRPWLWAVVVGGWFPVLALLENRGPAAAVALAFALVGACGGRLLRRVVG